MSDIPVMVRMRKHYSVILKTGAYTGASLLLTGVVLSLFRPGSEAAMMPGDSPWERIRLITELDPEGLQLLGLFSLVLTPVIRVVWSVVLYASAKDRLMLSFALISLFFIIAGVVVKT